MLERVLDEEPMGDFSNGFGRWSEEDAQRVRADRQQAKEKRKGQM